MLGSVILDVAVGLLFIYLLLALLVTTLSELIEGALKARARELHDGLRELLGGKSDPTSATFLKALYEHPLIAALYRGKYDASKCRNLPSYIPARNFALAVLDISGTRPGESSAALSDMVGKVDNEAIRRVLAQALQMSAGNWDHVQSTLESWYNSTMDRVAGWYKRRSQKFAIVLSAIVVVGSNADSIYLAKRLYRDQALRSLVVESAQQQVEGPAGLAIKPALADTLLRTFELPLGWGPPSLGSPMGIAIVGWLGSILAVSLGAPFWFDVLNKIMVIRSTVKPHEKSPEEATEDRR